MSSTTEAVIGCVVERGDAKGFAASTDGHSYSYPLGATLAPGGANFSVFSRSAAGIDLLFFDRVDDSRP